MAGISCSHPAAMINVLQCAVHSPITGKDMGTSVRRDSTSSACVLDLSMCWEETRAVRTAQLWDLAGFCSWHRYTCWVGACLMG